MSQLSIEVTCELLRPSSRSMRMRRRTMPSTKRGTATERRLGHSTRL